jgi:predicted NBD/HSP70 family sugar kinase
MTSASTVSDAPSVLSASRSTTPAKRRRVALLADVLNPRAVVLGGYFAHLGVYLIDRVRDAVQERVMAPNAGGCEVVLSTLGFTAPARGGAFLALDAVYQDPVGAAAS